MKVSTDYIAKLIKDYDPEEMLSASYEEELSIEITSFVDAPLWSLKEERMMNDDKMIVQYFELTPDEQTSKYLIINFIFLNQQSSSFSNSFTFWRNATCLRD